MNTSNDGTPPLVRPERRPSYEVWVKLVDDACWDMAGCSLHDLPDVPLRDWYDSGLRALAAARKAVRQAKDEGR